MTNCQYPQHERVIEAFIKNSYKTKGAVNQVELYQTARHPFTFIACSANKGATELDILNKCKKISGRNYFTLLERNLGIRFKRITEPNNVKGRHSRYILQSREDALKVFNLIKQQGKINYLEEDQIKNILEQYPATSENSKHN